METYDVNLDALMATNVGIAIKDIRNCLLPFLRRHESEALSSLGYHKGIRGDLEEVLSRLQSVRSELVALEAKIEGGAGGNGFRKILAAPRGLVKQSVDVDVACASFTGWAATCDHATEGLRKAIDTSLANESEGVECLTEFLGIFRGAIKFWESALDVYVCDYVFEHVQMKYKTKLCREIVRVLPPVVQDGRMFLAQFDAGKFDFGKNNEYFRERAEEVVDAAANRLDVYRRVKAMIEDQGIAAAFDEWKRALEYSKSLAISHS